MIHASLLLLFFLWLCKDPFFKKCDDLCIFVNECTKKTIQIQEESFYNKIYPYCVNACFTYFQEMSECYDVKKDNSCEKLMNCIAPILMNR
ncbi:MAG: Cys-rich protein [Leptonema sp. (in: bacteria)]